MPGAGWVAIRRRLRFLPATPLLPVLLLLAGCAAPRAPIVLPDGAGTPYADYQTLADEALRPCRGVRTLELALAINARTPERRLRGDVLAALARPGSIRLVGVAPIGAPVFVLVADGDAAVLVEPRERRYVTGATADALLRALAGLPLGPADFQAVLTGCLVPEPRVVAARAFGNGWIGLDLEGGATVFVRPGDEGPLVVGGRRAGLDVEYGEHVRGLPRLARVVVAPAPGTREVTDITARLSRVNINTELHPEVFTPPLREDYVALTVDEFRALSPPLEVEAGADGERP